jgi:hypothetical protein
LALAGWALVAEAETLLTEQSWSGEERRLDS